MNDATNIRARSGEGEWELLDRQAREAKEAMRRTAREMVDVRVHIQQHPWIAVGTASLAGVATAGLLRGLGNRDGAQTAQNVDSRTAPKRSTFTPLLTTIVGEAIKFLIPALFTGAVLSKTEEQLAEAHSEAAE